MKTFVFLIGMLIPYAALTQSTSTGSHCSIMVEKTKKVPNPSPILRRTTDEDCEITETYKYREGADHEAGVLKTRLLTECALSHDNCTVSIDTIRGASYPGSEIGAFSGRVCVTGIRVKTVDLSDQEVLSKQCEKIDKCIQDALNSGNDTLYQMAKDLYTLKKCQ